MNKLIAIGFCCILSAGITGCYAPVDKDGQKTLTFDAPLTESEQASENYVSLAFQYINAGQLGTARTKIDQAIKFDASNPRAYLAYALIYEREKESALATSYFEKAAVYGGGSEVAMYHALFLYNSSKYEQANRYFDKCVSDASYDKRALCFELLGFNDMRMNNPQKAIGSFTKATQLNPNMPISYLSLANLYLEKSDFTAGYRAFKQYDQMDQYIDSVSHTAQSIWLGIQLSSAIEEKGEVLRLANLLNNKFPASEEVKLYNAWLVN